MPQGQGSRKAGSRAGGDAPDGDRAAGMPVTILPGHPPVAIDSRASRRARRITLRIGAADGRVTLTRPAGVPEAAALAFAREREAWLRQKLRARPADIAVRTGTDLPVEGMPFAVAAARGRARIEDGRLLVPAGRAGPGAAALLKHLARERLATAADRHAAALGVRWGPLALRDPRGRWGSCTAAGRLMFSWRLAMAPPEVLDYVAAHEVAHRVHMDHSPAFWAAVERLRPDWRTARDWLRAEGPGLHRYRFDA